MRIQPSTEDEIAKQLDIVKASLAKNTSTNEQIDIEDAQRKSAEKSAQLLADAESNQFFTAREQHDLIGYPWLIQS
jgi:hypothetical protein